MEMLTEEASKALMHTRVFNRDLRYMDAVKLLGLGVTAQQLPKASSSGAVAFIRQHTSPAIGTTTSSTPTHAPSCALTDTPSSSMPPVRQAAGNDTP
jgi:hypothetical protein